VRLTFAALAIVSVALSHVPAIADPIPVAFDSVGADRKAIDLLLETYTKAVSTKNQALFETLLLNKNIQFSDARGAIQGKGADGSTQRYETFRKGVFEGPPFTQQFQNVHVSQDGPLASVSLVFVNTSAQGSSWGWKTLQLLKIDERWLIASEFYTGHAG
jgi:hypothetical protein